MEEEKLSLIKIGKVPNLFKNADETLTGKHDIADALRIFLLILVQVYQNK